MFHIKCKVKKVDFFKKDEVRFVPPNHIKQVKETVLSAMNVAQYTENPVEYYQKMAIKLYHLELLEKEHSDCMCAIKINGNIQYTTVSIRSDKKND